MLLREWRNYRSLATAAVFLALASLPLAAQAQPVTFDFTGSPQTWVVPPGVTSVTVDARGAQGGGNGPTVQGGKGGRVLTTLSVTPGETLTIYVGGQSVGLPLSGGPGGFNGGGNGGFDNVDNNAPGAGGGGASDVRQGGDDLAHRVVVAGGGGGAECCLDANGGDGGGLVGATGGTSGGGSNPGGGGTQSSGGAGGGGCNGNGGDGALLQGGGGGNGNRAGGGGGGGYYGGGGGGGCVYGSGGGGGSSYSAGTNTVHTQGFQSGNGQVVIAIPGCVPPPSGMVAWWPGDGNANDIVGTNNGTLENGATFGAGEVGQAFSFDGVDDYVLVSDAPDLDITTGITIDSWINPSTVDQIDGSPVLAKGPGTLEAYAFDLANRYLRFYFRYDANVDHFYAAQVQNWLATDKVGVWTHVAATYDAATGVLSVYTNGVQAATANAPPGTLIRTNSDPVSIGSRRGSPSTGYDRNFAGELDEVGIYNRALSQAEIEAIFLAGSAGKCKSPPASIIYGNNNCTVSGCSHDPVNTATGNYAFQRTDLALPGRGLPLAFIRTYNSLDTYSGPLGTGWTHSYNAILTENPDSSVAIKQGEGHEEVYDPAGGGNYTSRFPGVFNVLVKNLDGSFTLTQKNQTAFRWSGGHLVSETDRNGNVIAFGYDGSGRLSTITDTVGRVSTLTYDASNRITKLTDPISRTVLYSYDGSGNLASVTDLAGGVMTFAYDASHRVTSIHDQRGSQLLANTYDSSGRVVTQANGRGFTTAFAYGTPNPGDTTMTDPRGNATIHTHDAQFRLLVVKDANGKIQDFTYDSQNDRTSSTNQNGKTTNFSYDSRGNLTSLTDPLGHSSSFGYDTMNDLIAATNARGKTTTFTYDVKGNLLSVKDALMNTTAFAYDSFGELVSKTDARGGVTTFTYDSSGNLTRITDPLGKATNLAYDAVGRLTSITDPNGHAATATYDALSRLTIAADPLGNQTKFTYDAVGNLLKVTDAKGNATNYAYDATNDLTSVTDALAHVTSYAYDSNNNRASFTNAKGKVTSYTFDPVNRLVAATDPLSFVTSYSYDGVGSVVSVTDAKSQLNQFGYDAVNRLTSIAYADGKNVTYSYDENGNRTSMVDSRGTTSYSYDALDRVTSVVQPGGSTVAYTYDSVGNRKSISYPDGKTTNYAYDSDNRLSQATDWLSRATGYAYDPAGNLTNTSYSTGAGMTFSYDAANRLKQVVETFKNQPSIPLAYTLDAVGNRTAFSVAGIATNYTYDALNELLSAKLGPFTTTWTYDAVGNRTKQVSPFGTVNYTYDAGDRLLTAGSTGFTYDANGSRVTKFTAATTIAYAYDAANRLTAVSGPVNSSFAYDGDGNRVSQVVGAGTYSYVNDVASALPVALQESGPDGSISYAYGLGLISESSSSFNYFYQYDGLGSIATLSNSAGKLAGGYLYDAWGSSLGLPPGIGTKNKFRFTGEALDPGTGLYYLRARYYDPQQGEFIGKDPYRGTANAPTSLNRYTYARNNPTYFRDPSGLSPTFLSELTPDQERAQTLAALERALRVQLFETDLSYRSLVCGDPTCQRPFGFNPPTLDTPAVPQTLTGSTALSALSAAEYLGAPWLEQRIDQQIQKEATAILNSQGVEGAQQRIKDIRSQYDPTYSGYVNRSPLGRLQRWLAGLFQ